MKNRTYSYLALGDSYTIGEQVAIYESFPYQTVQLLRKAGMNIHAAEIIAKTGWTTDELDKGINDTITLKQYDIVSLLIGVNNQYRGRSAKEYEAEFNHLLQRAIQFAGGNTSRVFVLSIPDWGVTPFAERRDRIQIAKEIDEYNTINKQIAASYNITYIDITAGTREAVNDPSLLTADKLHPSGKDYARWAQKLFKAILASLQ
jgi:lysophospholipase L1-like esterase